MAGRNPPAPGWLLLILGSCALGAGPARTVEPPPDPFAECEKGFAKDPRGWKSCDCFQRVATGKALYDEALRRLEDHLASDPSNPCLHRNLGRLETILGKASAAAHLRAAIESYAHGGESAGEVYARINLSDLLDRQGAADAAERELAAAEVVARRAGDAMLLAEVSVLRAKLLLREGADLEAVEQLLRKVERQVLASDHASLQRETLKLLGGALHQLGRHAEAEARYQHMIEVTQKKADAAASSDLYGEAAARQGFAIAYMARPPSAQTRARSIELVRAALAVAELARHREVEADARRLLGRLLGGEEGERELERGLALARELGSQAPLARALAALAALSCEQDPAAAERLLGEAAALDLDVLGPVARRYGWFDRLKVSWATLPRQQAIEHARAELAAIEELRRFQTDSLTRAEIFSVWADAYSWLAGRLLESASTADLDLAFELLERRHARVLLESSGAAPAEAQSSARLDEVRAALGEDEALLYFQQSYERDVFGDFAGGSWLLVITRAEVRVYPTADPLEVDPVLPTFISLFARRDGSEAEAAATLSRGLLGAALAEFPAGVERLVIVPDEDLHLLPFAALRASVSEPSLAERYELEIVPSATLWLRWRRTVQAPASPAVLALADPDLGSGATAPAALERGWVLEQGRPLGALPHARREGRRVVRELGSGSELRVGREASEQALKSTDLASFGMVHFAAHAVVDGERSERSAIVLAAAGEDDGLLEPREIRALDLSGKAVVLSACRSAVGDVLAGEGPLSLAHAFFAAGARTVVASLWPLRDDEAARFFDRFYRHLARGESAGSALAASQREMIAAGEPASVWAGVVLLGDADWRIAPVPGGGIPWWVAAGVLGMAGLGVAVGLRWRSRGAALA